MFEHKNLDGEWNRIIPSNEAFLKGDILECRDTAGTDAKAMSRRQYSVVGNRLVERCLPPETIGDFWSFDATGTPWWGSVKNPPHMGLIAEFNSHLGGEHRKPIDLAHNVVAFATGFIPWYVRVMIRKLLQIVWLICVYNTLQINRNVYPEQ